MRSTKIHCSLTCVIIKLRKSINTFMYHIPVDYIALLHILYNTQTGLQLNEGKVFIRVMGAVV